MVKLSFCTTFSLLRELARRKQLDGLRLLGQSLKKLDTADLTGVLARLPQDLLNRAISVTAQQREELISAGTVAELGERCGEEWGYVSANVVFAEFSEQAYRAVLEKAGQTFTRRATRLVDERIERDVLERARAERINEVFEKMARERAGPPVEAEIVEDIVAPSRPPGRQVQLPAGEPPPSGGAAPPTPSSPPASRALPSSAPTSVPPASDRAARSPQLSAGEAPPALPATGTRRPYWSRGDAEPGGVEVVPPSGTIVRETLSGKFSPEAWRTSAKSSAPSQERPTGSRPGTIFCSSK
jgi:hypothetical protein